MESAVYIRKYGTWNFTSENMNLHLFAPALELWIPALGAALLMSGVCQNRIRTDEGATKREHTSTWRDNR